MRNETFVYTKEDWYPSIDGNKLRLFCNKLLDGTYRVAVWGNDDYGLQLDFEKSKDALDVYEILKEYEYITRSILLDFGFVRA